MTCEGPASHPLLPVWRIYLPGSDSKFWEFVFSLLSWKDSLAEIDSNELPIFTVRSWKINSSNGGKRGCDAGPSKVTLNLSVYKAYKKSSCISQHFNVLFLLREGHFLGFFTQAKSLRTWHIALLETPGRLQLWKMVALETKYFLMVSHLILHLNSFAVLSFLLHLFFWPCWPNEHFAAQWSCLNLAISTSALVLHSSHGHLIIFDF